MNNTNLQIIFDDKLKQVLRLLKRYYKTLDEEDLHKLRVQIKRMEAMLALPQFEAILKQHDKIKNLFQRSGKIRERQMMLQTLRNIGRFDKSAYFAHKIQHKIKSLQKDFLKKNDAHLHLLKKVIVQKHQLNNEITRDDFLNYYKSLAVLVNAQLNSGNKKTDLHKVRKNLKQLMYNIELLNRNEIKWLKNYTRIDLLDNLQELLGNWHDYALLMDELKSLEENDQLSELIEKVKMRVNQLRKEIKNVGAGLSV